MATPVYPSFLTEVLDRTWFRRMWTVQEVALARKCLVVCGKQSVSWTSFNSALARLELCSAFYGVTSYITGHSIPWDHLRFAEKEEVEGRQPGSSNLSAILTHSRGKLATDAKDKVYALYGIFKTLRVRLAEPDYNRDIVEIYKEATVAALVCDFSLSILKQAAGPKHIAGLPSWVPDWSDSRIRHFPSDACKAHWTVRMQIAFTPETDVLMLRGSVAGFVTELPGADHDVPPSFEMAMPSSKSDQAGLDELGRSYIKITKTLREWVHTVLHYRHGVDELGRMLMQGRPLGAYQSAFHKWLRYLMAGWPGWSLDEVYREQNFHNHSLRGLEAFYENNAVRYWTERLEWQVLCAIHASEEARSFHRIVCEALDGRVLFKVSSAGAMPRPMVCLATDEIRYGDWLVLFAGAEFPMMVRPTRRTVMSDAELSTPITGIENPVHEYYTLVGPVYVVGMMHGSSKFALDKDALDGFYLI
jgi:hypothetical protein